jgi:hypothetical protein
VGSDDAHFVVSGKSIERFLGRLPHFERHGVMAQRVVEGDEADARLLARENFVGWLHFFIPCLCRRA